MAMDIRIINAELHMRRYAAEHLGSSFKVGNFQVIREDIVKGKIYFSLFDERDGEIGSIYYNRRNGGIKYLPVKENIGERVNEIFRREGII